MKRNLNPRPGRKLAAVFGLALALSFACHAQNTDYRLGTFYMVSEEGDDGSLGPPWPFDPYPGLQATPIGSNGAYLVDDTSVALAKALLTEHEGTNSGPAVAQATRLGFSPMSFGPNDFYIQIDAYSNDFAFLTLHGTTNDPYDNFQYEVLSTTNLGQPDWKVEWVGLGENGQTVLPPLAMEGRPMRFFRAIGSVASAFFNAKGDAIEPNPAIGDNGQVGIFNIVFSSLIPRTVNIYYSLSGSATEGVDYTNLSGVLTIPAGQFSGNIFI